MHIPKSATDACDILPFDAALGLSEVPTDAYDVGKWHYIPPYYDEYRYVLGTRGSRPLICVGINPSTAEPDHLDPTLQSAQRIALANGYDSFLMFNVYAQRATRPDDMEKEPNLTLHAENMRAFEWLLGLCARDTQPCVWAAWGTIIQKRAYLGDCLADMIALGDKYHATWYRAGRLSSAGHPHHPLYLKASEPLVPFDVDAYLQTLKK